jgi:Inverse autotransporter, beta-domain/Invasin, domain 3/Bacterial Ig-like domain (group 1)
MSSTSHYSVRQRLSVWIMLSHYIFSLCLLTFPPGVRAQTSPELNPPHFILYQKTAQKSWQQIQQEMAPQIDNLEHYQQQLAHQYGLTLTGTLLLPDNGPQTARYPGVKLVQVGADEDLTNVAFRYHISLDALLQLNARVKSPAQLKTLAGQWIIVPRDHDTRAADAAAADDAASRVRDRMAAAWGSAQHNGAGDALRSTANSALNSALTEEVEAWLNHTGGKAKVTADVGLGGSDSSDFGLDFLWPVKVWQDDILFTQMSAHRWNDRNTLNLGLGWRHTFSPHLLAGGNLFFDQDTTRHHNRMGIGGELWSDRVRTSANYYLPLSGWRHSNDSMFNDDPDRYELYERAARGWDLNVETALSQHVSASVGWFQWYGDKVDVNGTRSEASRNPHGLNVGLNWQPVPLLGVSAEQSFISGQSDNFTVGLNFHWEFGRKLSEMLATENATAMPSLMQSRNEFVTRNNNIVLAYKQKEKDWRLYFTPTEKTTQVGVPMRHAVKGGRGGSVRYTTSNATIASVDEASGQVTPKQRGDVAITATETSPTDSSRVFSSASYHLTVTPGDFAPSVSGVAIEGDMSPGKTLTGSYTFASNQGEDEDPAQTQLRWIDKTSGALLKEGSASWEVRADDMSKTLIFQVVPVNKKGIAGEAGTAEISGSASITELRIDHLLTPGEVRPDGSVKFFAESNGALLLVAEVKDGKGAPLADQWVHWQSQTALGTLSKNSVRTDAKGQALVKMEGIMSGGQDQIVASLTAPVASFSGAGATGDDGSPQRESMKLNIDFSHAFSVNFTQAPEQAEVATEQTFVIQVTDQDNAALTVPTAVTWYSNGEKKSGTTDNHGQASITLVAPEKVADGWNVSVDVGNVQAPAKPVALVAGEVARVELSVPESAVAGSSDAEVSAELYDSFDNPVISRKQAIDWRITGSQFSGAASGDSDANGRVVAKVIIPKVAPSSVEVSAGKAAKTLQVVVGTVDSVELKATPDTLNANGSKATLTAIARDAQQNVVEGAAVVWSTANPELGTLSNQGDKTGPDGKATATLTSATLGGSAEITAEIGGKRKAVEVTLNGIPVVTSVTLDKTKTLKVGETLKVADYQVEENGSGKVDMSWQWTRDGNLISGATSDSYTLTEADTGAQMAVLAWAQNQAGNRGGKASDKTDKVIGLVSQVIVTPSTDSINADGSSTLVFTARALDINGIAVPDEAIQWGIDKPALVTQKSHDDKTNDKGEGKIELIAQHTGGDIQVTATVGSKNGSNDASLKGIPVITRITLSKTSGLKVGDTVSVADISVEENGGGAVTYSYQWGRDLNNYSGGISGATASSYTLTEADTGAKIFVYITAINAAKNSGSRESGSTQPIVGVVATVAVTSDVEAVNANGSNTVVFTAEAKDKLGVPVPRAAIGWGFDKPELITQGASDTETNDLGKGSVTVTTQQMGGVVTATGTIGGKPGKHAVTLKGIPAITHITLNKTSGLKVGDTVSVADISVEQNGGGAVTYRYQWGRDTGSESSGIYGATGSTYTLTDADTGMMISVDVYATNDAGNEGYAQSEKTARVIGTVATINVTASADSIDANGNNTLTFTAKATDRRNVAVPGEAMTWSIDNPSLVTQGATSTTTDNQGEGTMTLTTTQTGGAINVTALAGGKNGSDGVQINGIPVITKVTLDKTSGLKVGDTIKVSQVDVDERGGGSVTTTYQWAREINSVSGGITGATQQTYKITEADTGAMLYAWVTVTNSAQKTGNLASAKTAKVIGKVTRVSVAANKTTVDADSSSTVTYTVTAYDKNSVVVPGEAISWNINTPSLVTPGAKSSTTNAWGQGSYTLRTNETGGSLQVYATVNGFQSSSAVTLKGAPIVEYVAITPTSNLKPGTTVSVDTSSTRVNQNGGGATNWQYQWRRNGVDISGANASGYTLQSADGGKQISLMLTAVNGANKRGSRESSRTQSVVIPRMRIAQQSYYYFVNGALKRVYEPHASVVDENGNGVGGVEVCFSIKRDDWWDGDSSGTFRERTGSDGKTPVHQISAKLKASVYFNAWICAGGSKPNSTVYMWGGGNWTNAPSDWTGWVNR